MPDATPNILPTVTGGPIEVLYSEQAGDVHFQAFRPADGKLRVTIRHPDTGYVELSARNLEILMVKLMKLKAPYQVRPESADGHNSAVTAQL